MSESEYAGHRAVRSALKYFLDIDIDHFTGGMTPDDVPATEETAGHVSCLRPERMLMHISSVPKDDKNHG